MRGRHEDTSISRYVTEFEAAALRPDAITFDASPVHLGSAIAPPWLRRFLPTVRLIGSLTLTLTPTNPNPNPNPNPHPNPTPNPNTLTLTLTLTPSRRGWSCCCVTRCSAPTRTGRWGTKPTPTLTLTLTLPLTRSSAPTRTGRWGTSGSSPSQTAASIRSSH